MSVLQEPSKAKDVANNEDDDDINVNDFLNMGANKDLWMPAMDEEPFRAHHDQPNDRPTTCQRLSFSQNTPPAFHEEAPEKRGTFSALVHCNSRFMRGSLHPQLYP